jgi:hypothetical protein
MTDFLAVMVTARSTYRNELSMMKLWLRREKKLILETV